MSAAAFSFEDPFRPIYEYHSTAAWGASGIITALMGLATDLRAPAFIAFTAFCFAMATVRGRRAWRMRAVQRHLVGVPLSFMSRGQLDEIIAGRQGEIFLGYGFPWTQAEAQMTHMIRRRDPALLVPPANEEVGQGWIHGLGAIKERRICIPISHTAGHTLLVGTTRAGKSRMLDTIIHQAVARGEAVLIWDPKGDKGLATSAYHACLRQKKGNDFVFFHPAFPEHSWRLDPLKNFNRATELATRIASLIPSETGADPFTAHSWMILTNLIEGLLLLNAKPTLRLLKRFVDNGPEWLVARACEAHFDKHIPDWRKEAAQFLKQAKDDKSLAIAYDNYYLSVVQRLAPSGVIEGLLSDLKHDRSHQQKMTASLTPVLTMLTAGTLGELLSPDTSNLDDRRPITNFANIIRNGQVCYLGLDSLSDSMVASAIGSMFISDMTSVSGDRYNYEDNAEFIKFLMAKGEAPPPRADAAKDRLRPVTLIIDEAAELCSDKLIQLLNKAGGSQIRLVIATQTFADFSAKVGSDAKARMILGNLNNKIVLRTIDGGTQEYIAETFPQTMVRHIEYSQATDAKSDTPGAFGYKLTEAMKETEVPIVSAELLGCLPNLEFFAQVSGGRLLKGRIPILNDELAPKAAA
ncbi:hypothetical protein RHOFW510R12_00695 [Rhodanobacter sp. FW510-R12]|uniref:conjugative transfer system coupling protein TraD n=1 Tax=Rhodanobacter thiooxydans TaxID=416169 RepID=UPI00091C537A|nr:conjugative transfer system coupling protein TraD [Rhodanobacter thiooxydans]UJJ56759.1 conjugative transfer system coupling protein TraD [Rhodanobacter thiooxydans]